MVNNKSIISIGLKYMGINLSQKYMMGTVSKTLKFILNTYKI